MSDNQLNNVLKALHDFNDSQHHALLNLENSIKALENNDIIHEYELLRSEFDAVTKENDLLRTRADKLADENESLRSALAGQIFNARMSTIRTSEKNLEIFFAKENNSSLNELSAFEMRVKQRIQNLYSAINKHHIEATSPIAAELDAVRQHIEKIIAEEYALHRSETFTAEEKQKLDAIKNAPLTDEQIKKAARKNSLESFIGSNFINKLGIILIVIGVVALLQFSLFNAANEIKSAIAIVFGVLFILSGEGANRKHPGIFSVGCTACGIAVLFAALAVSYFSFGIIPMYAALAMCILITAAAFALSARYNSPTIFTFALIGGYMPIAVIFENKNTIYAAMLYFMILNIFSLASAFKFKWRVCAFIGTILNIIGTSCIVFVSGLPNSLIIAYEFAAFLIYTAIPLISTKRTNDVFKASDVVMLALNTVFSSLIFYLSFGRIFGRNSLGILSIILTVIYSVIGYTVGRNKMRPLFFITALSFSVMIIPFQFGHAWVSLAWLAEGCLLTVYGILANEKSFRRYGFPVYILCAFGFLIIDVICRTDFLFFTKYTALTLSAVMITVCYIIKNLHHTAFARAFKYITAVNLWFYIIYISCKAADISNMSSIGTLLFLALTFALAYLLMYSRAVRDSGSVIISYILYTAALISSLFLPGSYSSGLSTGMKILSGLIIVTGDILCVLSAVKFAYYIFDHSKIGIQWYPLAVSVYLVILTAAELTGKFGLSFTHTAVTVIYTVTAFSQIVIGFICRFPYLRRFGLALALFSAVKLFIFDLWDLTGGYRIICYFALGTAFMAISYIYQIFEKKFSYMGAEKND